jgi:DNA invertase Pin-like site-specific DNA recombinase
VIVQEVSLLKLKEMGLTVIPVDAPDYYTGDSPSLTMIRQILACISGYEKNILVQRMKVARDRVRKQRGKCEGRKSLQEIYGDLRFRTLQKKARKLLKERLSYAKISKVLASQGWVQPSTGQPFHRSQVMRLIKQ